MFNKILIANRGEIALRIIRACRELRIPSVAVYSQADADSLHVRAADEAVCVGPPAGRESYLNVANILSAALITGADAIHPGYGFLAENSTFAEACEASRITFIGPSRAAIDGMGDKHKARELMQKAGVPVVPGSPNPISSEAEALSVARKIDYPVMIKAVAGGGGKGIRICHSEDELLSNLKAAQTEAESAFGNAGVIIEKFIEEPRHIEFQILGDRHGNAVHLGERDCSVQTRRYQKMVEEAPSIALTDDLRREMGEAAVKAAKAVDYNNAGTVEFLLDSKGGFYFLEMNTRIQVEAPVTEMVTGVDLIRQQILIASGEKLPFRQSDIHIHGHAIEARITAEDPDRGFAPNAGKVDRLILPGGYGTRVDTHLYAGYEVPSFYDSMLAKLIVWGENRDEAINRMVRCLDEFEIAPLITNIAFQRRIFQNPYFRRGDVSTAFLQRRMGV
ncbi:MAG TPA: acetyl-CoA carboxylase biotin carboxylase subunit [Armatimonadota bacterium]|jgi:acetyl-CoA carboxylase biotin carboxylase subunit